ncbi:MAG: transglycosylase SLT domain-containing protein [Ardenticatenaceae bacterium]|nr:transglycosylase SLT domain-containing protein [Anaerolineales bacterium]MCB8920550.1 transglycosylase SLT domain-containing protein [Ardenticatenaceae bacterium]MCB8990173.1 transglycosylase SLT domain-containing protein [Ardenticatenaceae bacterium]MCB9003036.1 transglycosylase SLT domain-containing protein [Ardenticatenaceae bacterium]
MTVIVLASPGQPQTAQARSGLRKTTASAQILSPIWDASIRQWSTQIGAIANEYGLDPDLIAAVVREESHGDHQVVSYMGAVGLMGVMPTGPGLEWRPSAEALKRPTTNLHWGAAILTEIIQQSGGDVYSALAAYSGGWELAQTRVPRLYASSILNNYGRAVAARNGISPDIATQWTVAIEMRRGHVTDQRLLVLGDQPVSGLRTYGGHTIYAAVDESGMAYHIHGYAVPVALVVPVDVVAFGHSDMVETPLQLRLGEEVAKVDNSNPEVLMACLPSLSRLRGRVSTRWYAPSQCPSWHR